VNLYLVQPRRTTRRSIAASGSPPLDATPASLPSTARKTRKSVANLAPPIIRDEFSPTQDNVQVVVPSTVTKVARKKPSVAMLQEESEPEEEKEKGVSKAGKIAEEVSRIPSHSFACPLISSPHFQTTAPVVARTVKGRKSVMLQDEREADGNSGNFSDFNPFQSGGEASPGMGVAETVRLRKKRQASHLPHIDLISSFWSRVCRPWAALQQRVHRQRPIGASPNQDSCTLLWPQALRNVHLLNQQAPLSRRHR
jgi:hypothetical protein